MTQSKVVFIIVTRGFIVRNILRSGVLDELLQAGLSVIVFFQAPPGQELPGNLRREFDRPGVTLETVSDAPQKGYSLFAKIGSMFVYSKTTSAYIKLGNTKKIQRGRLSEYVEFGVYAFFRLLAPFKRVIRSLEENFFFANEYEQYFDEYQPSVVFGTSVISKLDIMFMKAARRRGVATIAMPKGWDNVVKALYRFVPDVLIVQNERMKASLEEVQGISPDQIVVAGFPQFDWFTRSGIIVPRGEFMERLGLPPERKLIVFGSEGVWAPDDRIIADSLARMVNTQGACVEKAALLVRPHFSDVKTGRLISLGELPNVVVDSSITPSTFFMDNWDPGLPETLHFTNLIYHADVLVSIVSTLALDAACADTPVVGPFYGGLIKRGVDTTRVLYETDHYQWVIETGAVSCVHNDQELQAAINAYLSDPSLHRKERRDLVERLCFGNDGKSAHRVARAIIDAMV